MGADLSIYGIKPKDSKYDKMSEIWYNCKELGIEIPDDVYAFFEDEPPNGKGIADYNITDDEDVFDEITENGFYGYDVDLENLRNKHPDIKILRVGISY